MTDTLIGGAAPSENTRLAPARPVVSRRGIVGGLGLAAVAAGLGIAGEAKGACPILGAPADAELERHWRSRRDSYAVFAANPDILEVEHETAAQPYWDRINAAEKAILVSPLATARAAELRLWLAFYHVHDGGAGIDAAITSGDPAPLLAIRNDLDWHEKMIFAAILNLRGEG